MGDSGRKTSYKRKELGGSVVGSLLVKSFKTPNQILKDALNEYEGKEATNDIANEPKVVAGRELEPVILKIFMDQVKPFCNNKQKVKMTVPNAAHLYQLKNGKLGSSLDGMLHISPGNLELSDYTKKVFSLSKQVVLECKNYSGAAEDEPYPAYKYQIQQALLTTGCEHGILVRFVRGWQLQWFVYPRDHKMIDEIINAGEDFWNRFDGVRQGHDYWYPPQDTKEASEIYKGNGSKEVQDMSTHNKLGILIEQYVSASADEKEAKKRKDAASMYMKEIVGANEVVQFNNYIIRHSTNQKKKTKSVTIPGEFTSYRRFTVEGGK
ncbi:endonuclease [uncultured Mediterranean phage uvMED]|nr:endonuclease [uncultured Mediterranean phage uvMED]